MFVNPVSGTRVPAFTLTLSRFLKVCIYSLRVRTWFQHIWRGLTGAVTCRRGNVMTTAALAAFPLLLAATGAIEMFSMSNDKALLQTAADAGALAGAGRLSIASYNATADVTATAIATARQNVAGASDPSIFSFSVTVDEAGGTVTVNGAASHKSVADLVGLGNTAIHAKATAEALQKTPLCILQTTNGSIGLTNNSQIKAPGCLIHANQDVTVASSGRITADRIQAAGKVTGPTYPTGNSGAIVIPDPFANLDMTPTKLCDVSVGLGVGLGLISTDTYVQPGIHCLPMLVVGNARLHLLPGDHYFMGGLIMTQNSTIDGDDVALIFGPANVFNFADKATVRLTARKSGKFAGFLIATTRANHNTFKISSGNVSELLGTIYIPNAVLEVTAQGNVAQDSDWSVIVAQSLQLKNGPTLVINNNYAGSGVPVPEGVGPDNGVVLKQ